MLATVLPKFNKNEEREKEKGGERKQRNFESFGLILPFSILISIIGTI